MDLAVFSDRNRTNHHIMIGSTIRLGVYGIGVLHGDIPRIEDMIDGSVGVGVEADVLILR